MELDPAAIVAAAVRASIQSKAARRTVAAVAAAVTGVLVYHVDCAAVRNPVPAAVGRATAGPVEVPDPSEEVLVQALRDSRVAKRRRKKARRRAARRSMSGLAVIARFGDGEVGVVAGETLGEDGDRASKRSR